MKISAFALKLAILKLIVLWSSAFPAFIRMVGAGVIFWDPTANG